MFPRIRNGSLMAVVSLAIIIGCCAFYSVNAELCIEAKQAGSASQSGSPKTAQICPQRVRLEMDINQVHRFDFQYSQVEDYPFDLYYLFGLSNSSQTQLELLHLSDKLRDTMTNLTSNFQIGFGTFIDKVSKFDNPRNVWSATHIYRNRMALSKNTAEFTTQMKNLAGSVNLDAPEGGLEAIMQAIACRHHIGWRDQARRLLVFSTDAGFHYAGDGKLGGVIVPNDGECHLDRNGFYTESTEQDYPSISQINQKVKENSINIIFAVTANQHSVYEKLAKHIQGSSSAILSNDSSNVVELVQAEYAKISSSVEMKDNATSYVKINYFSSCLTDKPEKQTSSCDGLKVGDVVKFTAEITVTYCPPDPRDWKQFIQIYPVGINESLVIDLTMLCDGGNIDQVKSPNNSNDVHNTADDLVCRADNITTINCSGRGVCVLGECSCNLRSIPYERIYGKFCECDNFSCDRSNGLICSGPDHGTCDCGVCKCQPDWKGSACDCRKSMETCKAPNSDEICSGHGECQCGQCKCKLSEEGRYSGKYCERCPTCLRQYDRF